MTVHYTDSYLINPVHKVTIELVGVGGTGSQVLTGLARTNEALMALGHPGFHVRAWDPDTVTTANMGRQLFSTADLDQNKAIVLISRINRFFGYEWQAEPIKYTSSHTGNIIITCVDSAAARIKIYEGISAKLKKDIRNGVMDKIFYWLDIGNLQKTGQVVLGSFTQIKQPKSEFKTKTSLPNVIRKFPQIKKIKEENQGPSCSLAEALTKQDLFINSTLAQFGCNLLWKLFREGMIRYHGCYVNLESCSVNPIRI